MDAVSCDPLMGQESKETPGGSSRGDRGPSSCWAGGAASSSARGLLQQTPRTPGWPPVVATPWAPGQARPGQPALPRARPADRGAHSLRHPLTSVSCGVADRLCKGSALLGGPLQPPRGDEPRGPSVCAHERGHVEGPGGGLCVSPPLPRGPVSQPCQSLETRLAAAPLSASSGAGALSGAVWGLSPLRDMMAAAASWCRGRSRSDVREGAVGTGTKPPQPRRDLPRFVVLAPPCGTSPCWGCPQALNAVGPGRPCAAPWEEPPGISASFPPTGW